MMSGGMSTLCDEGQQTSTNRVGASVWVASIIRHNAYIRL